MQNSSTFQSPRYLVLRHAQRALRKINEGDPPDENLEPGYERLRSYFLPGMTGGLHTIQVTQPMSGKGQHSTLETTQKFNVQAPRFILPDDAIHTKYPPQGFTATAETLPHVFFNDPTMPWERVGSWDARRNNPDDYFRNRTPWLAVIVFTADELKLADADLTGPTSIFRNVPTLKNGAKQDSTFKISLPVNQFNNVESTVNSYGNLGDDQTVADTIYLKRELFTALFSKYTDRGNVEPTTTPYVYSHRFLAHKEIINTEGMAVSGAVSVNDTGSFGAIVSCRSGPPNITVPTPLYVHLVSIEGVEQIKSWPLPSATKFVSLVSLASWNYICLPPNTPNVRDELIFLGSTLSTLRPSVSLETKQKLQNNAPVGPRLLDRINQGYSLSRYRVQTGEMTSCFVRGPFVPVSPYKVPEWFPQTSMVGTDLSILDRELGLMDITFSAAWQLGRTMAISDQSFTTTLYRVRSQIIQRATDATRAKYTGKYTWHKDKEELFSSLQDAIDKLDLLPHQNGLKEVGSVRRRWKRETIEPLDLSYHGPILEALVDPDFRQAAREVASTPRPDDPTKPSDKPYDEFNAPFSADWVIVLRWVLDRLFLDSIPAHYLLPDAALLPQESLRFFTIDDNWMNSFIDGALSLGNHIDQESDKVRDAIKGAINWYLQSPTSLHKYPPPIPKYGCYIRSGVISKFPDLIVKVEPAPKPDAAPVLLRHEVVDTGTMICLFSQPPSPATFWKLTLTQPPQQQSFVVGEKITDTQLTMAYRRAYTIKNPTDPDYLKPIEEMILKKGQPPIDRSVMYLWDVIDPLTNVPVNLNMLLVDNLAPDYNTQLNKLMPAGNYQDDMASSALMAWQLSNPSYLLPINTPSGFKHSPISHAPRALPVYKRTPAELPQPPQSQKQPKKYSGRLPSPAARAERQHYLPQSAPNPMGRYSTLTPVQKPKWIRDIERHQGKPKDGAPLIPMPVFQFFFWSMERPGIPSKPGTIPMLVDAAGGPMAQDLIFSVSIVKFAHPSFLLQYIQINIPLGPPSTGKAADSDNDSVSEEGISQGPLMEFYDGPGASMLSNLRFNPIVTIEQNHHELIIRLIPRSLGENGQTGTVPSDRCLEVSFLLAGVKVNVSKEEVVVVPTVIVQYKNLPAQTQNPPPFMTLEPSEDSED